MVPKEKKPHEVIPPSLCLCLCLVLVLVLAQPSGKGPRLPEVYCVISRLGCFGLFSKVRGLSPLPPAPPRCRPPGRSAGSRMGKPCLGGGGVRGQANPLTPTRLPAPAPALPACRCHSPPGRGQSHSPWGQRPLGRPRAQEAPLKACPWSSCSALRSQGRARTGSRAAPRGQALAGAG